MTTQVIKEAVKYQQNVKERKIVICSTQTHI